jgi:uncharacterized protein involved in copper resistance
LLTADEAGEWAFHCHLLYHMMAGMMNKVVVAKLDPSDVPKKSPSHENHTMPKQQKMDHSKMNHDIGGHDMKGMDHSKMDMPATDHSKMDHSQHQNSNAGE